MHLGIFAKTFPRPSLEATLDEIAERGLTHVQFNMSCAGLPTLPERSDEDLCVRIARSFRERGLTMAGVSGTFNLSDPDESRLAENLRRLDVLASACRWLDTRIITLCTGTRDPEDMWKWHPENVRRTTWESLVTTIRRAVEIADQHEVTLAIEPERNNVVSSVAKARRLLDEIASPWLKVVIDPANLMCAGDFALLSEILDEAFDWLGPDIVLAHAKMPPDVGQDVDREAIREYLGRIDPRWLVAMRRMDEAGELWREVKAMMSGDVPPALVVLQDFYAAYVKWLSRINYTGSLVMHGLHEEDVAPLQVVISGLIPQR
jgi:sugar phosphate isomerase/epimerase